MGTGETTRKGGNIAERLLAVGAQVVELVRQLPRDNAGRHVADQVMRSATSGGANYEEARAAESRADFIHKVGIAAKELRESVYWLRLIQRTRMARLDIGPLIGETEQLIAILIASARTARKQA